MGGVPSTPRLGGGARPQETADYLIGEFVGEKSFPLTSDREASRASSRSSLAISSRSPSLPALRGKDPVSSYSLSVLGTSLWFEDNFALKIMYLAMNNYNTRHLAKILIHLAWCLEDCVSAADVTSLAFSKALNALFVSSVFLKYLIENSKTDDFEELYLSLDETEPVPHDFSKGQHVENLVMVSALNFIAKVDVSPGTYLLHQELLNFLLIAMSTQLLSGPTPGPNDIHPFIDAAMAQESSLVHVVVRQLLLNYIIRPRFSVNSLSSRILSEGNQPGVLRRVGSAAANLMLLPLSYIVSSTGEASRSPLAEGSLNVLLVLIYHHKCLSVDYVKDKSDDGSFEPLQKEETYFAENPFRKAVENARDIEFDRVDIEGMHTVVRLCLAHETSVLLLYSLVHGNSDFLEYVLVRTDLDTLLMPMLETLYNAPSRTSNHIYMVLIIFLILSQDSSFNASIHKLMLPNVPWYRERLLNQTSLGSLIVIILIRTVKYNLSKLRDVYLHTNCLATLANMAPHVYRLSAYASERLSAELHIYTDFLRLVLEILNAILTYALPLNPEVVYAIMHRQEVFLPFKSHPRYNELLENIYTVVDFFNSRIDSQKMDADWSVEEVLQVIINNCRSWRGEGMKMFTQLRFTYEQESHPEEFFIPYVWQLVLSHSGFTFNPSSINLFPVPVEDTNGEEVKKLQNGEMKAPALQVETPV
ncbi:UNVERIFIED_CONTAM: Dymeclin [Sesamum radiatum]|uniref:Dymeclin n=1 Tax=Sesamum radiatum TaxID=300843 RepID=A0AAW2S869_SESRA